ncbi:MAG: hypothetical protein OXN86_11340 [Chloroflexota bacterium]|nr:hypothetical protein [Chloroflexota bacterium]
MSYREAMCDLSDIAKEGPAYVRVKALVTIVRETSPNNARHGDVMRELGLADELPESSIQGCAKCGHGNKALESFDFYVEEGKRAEEEERAGEDEEDPH